MSDSPSVADRFCYALAEINKLKSEYDKNDPLRFAKNKAAETSIKILSDAIYSAVAVVDACRMFAQDTEDKERT